MVRKSGLEKRDGFTKEVTSLLDVEGCVKVCRK